MQTHMETYVGGCHCGRVRFRVQGDLADVTDCNCSMCTKKGILHLIVPPDLLDFILTHSAFRPAPQPPDEGGLEWHSSGQA
jgi:hypothetical protein